MCGIVALSWEDEDKISEMNACQDHRGPDNSGEVVSEGVSLGHRRLSIIDLSEDGHQPMESNHGAVIVYNGEVYNYKDIRSDLQARGYTFTSTTDTEVIVNAYDEWGPELLERVNGMFSFVIFDPSTDQLFVARDHAGIKPLYYTEVDEGIAFASTPNPLLELKPEFKINDQIVRDYLLYGDTISEKETFFKGIFSFPKGHYARIDVDDPTITHTEWWSFTQKTEFEGGYEDAVSEVRDRFFAAVERRLVSDVPVGSCLSGGIDSSAITATVGNGIETFSAVYPGFEKDEEEYVDVMASETDIQTNKVQPSAEDFLDKFSDYIQALSEPPNTPSSLAQHLVFERANEEDVRVLLDGQGADEILAGYDDFFSYYLIGLLTDWRVKDALLETLKMISKEGARNRLGLIGIRSLPIHLQRRRYISQTPINQDLLERTDQSQLLTKVANISSLRDALQFRFDTTLPKLLKYEDRNSMWFSRESRTPFLDPQLLELISSLPESYIISDGKTKAIFRDAMDGTVPDEILSRTDKIGFETPSEKWLYNDGVKEMLREWFMNAVPYCSTFIDLAEVRQMVTDVLSNNDVNSKVMWRVLFLEAWHREFEDSLVID